MDPMTGTALLSLALGLFNAGRSAGLLPKPVEGFEDRLPGYVLSDIAEDLDKVHQKLDALLSWAAKSQKPPPTPTQVYALVRAVVDAQRKTFHPGKRAILQAALLNAFDPEEYESGETLRLLGILDDLHYGDIALLGRIAKSAAPAVEITDLAEPFLRSPELHHTFALIQAGLVFACRSTGKGVWVPYLDPSDGKRVAAETSAALEVSSLGRALIRLVEGRENNPES